LSNGKNADALCRGLRITVASDGQKHMFEGMVRAVTIQDFQARDYALHLAFAQQVTEDRITPLLPQESEGKTRCPMGPWVG